MSFDLKKDFIYRIWREGPNYGDRVMVEIIHRETGFRTWGWTKESPILLRDNLLQSFMVKLKKEEF